MSVTSCFLLLLFCLSFHPCNARRLAAAAAADKSIEKNFLISNQNVDKQIAVSPMMEYSSSSKEEISIAKRTQLNENTRELKDSKAKQKPLTGYEREKGGVDRQKESLVSVSWSVPQKKRGEKHPGFNLDYSAPKTHPPSHN